MREAAARAKIAGSIADRFGAVVDVSMSSANQSQAFLIKAVTAEVSLDRVVREKGGRIVLAGRLWVIAELPLHAGMALKTLPGIAFVGGVTLDSEQFAKVREQLSRPSLSVRAGRNSPQ